jgi:hypothetical protein
MGQPYGIAWGCLWHALGRGDAPFHGRVPLDQFHPRLLGRYVRVKAEAFLVEARLPARLTYRARTLEGIALRLSHRPSRPRVRLGIETRTRMGFAGAPRCSGAAKRDPRKPIKTGTYSALGRVLVRAEGLEPPRLASQEPKSCASASSATPAKPSETPGAPPPAVPNARWTTSPPRRLRCGLEAPYIGAGPT